MSVVVRLVDPAEHEAVAELLLAAYSADYTLDDGYRESLGQVAERAAEHEVWVAVSDSGPDAGEILGTVVTPHAGGLISELGRPGEIDFRLLGVAPAARRRGVGAVLTEHVVALGRERGASRVVMNSGPQMIGAHRLYNRLGFARFPERETRVLADGTRLFAFVFELRPAEAEVFSAHHPAHHPARSVTTAKA